MADTAAVQLMGMCESMWKPGLEPEELFETVSQCLLAGADRFGCVEKSDGMLLAFPFR